MDINEVYRQSCDIVMPHIRLEGNEIPVIDDAARENLRKGIEGFKTVVAQNPANWVAHWMIGKAHQALDENEDAYQAFLISHNINLAEQNVLRELALQCLKTKRFDRAAFYCQGAQEFDPEDYTLWANMAVAKLFYQKLDEAEHWAKKALDKLPGDEPSLRVLHFVKEIRDGIRQFPEDFDELENSL